MSAMRSKDRDAIDVAELRRALAYDAETGVFRWREDRASLAKAGGVAGSPCHGRGYRFIRFNYARYLAHRLAWLYVYGEWPNGRIDHVNGNTDDNRIANLRIATSQQNNWNSSVRRGSATGERHIVKKRGSYCVQFLRQHKRIYRKTFTCIEAAIADRNRVAALLHGEFASTR